MDEASVTPAAAALQADAFNPLAATATAEAPALDEAASSEAALADAPASGPPNTYLSEVEGPSIAEDLPPDFWEADPASRSDGAANPARTREPPKPLDNDAPVLEQLQSLFPGRITRVDPFETDESAEEPSGADETAQESLFD